MKLYFKTRQQAREFKSGKLVDSGNQSPQGKRFARDLSRVFKQKKEKSEHMLHNEMAHVLEYV